MTLPLTDSTLELAINNLDKYFSIIGTTDNFEETFNKIKVLIGCGCDTVFRENVSKNKKSIEYYSKLEISKIREMNQLDMRLYNHVINIW